MQAEDRVYRIGQKYTTNIQYPIYEDTIEIPLFKLLQLKIEILRAAIDGIENQTDPGEPLDRDIYDMSSEELAKYNHVPGSLEEALIALENDHAFLIAGDVFTDDLIEAWITWKKDNEMDPMALRPHPYEFHLYYDS